MSVHELVYMIAYLLTDISVLVNNGAKVKQGELFMVSPRKCYGVECSSSTFLRILSNTGGSPIWLQFLITFLYRVSQGRR